MINYVAVLIGVCVGAVAGFLMAIVGVAAGAAASDMKKRKENK